MMPKNDEQSSNSSTLAANVGDLFASIIYALRDNSRYAYHYTSAEKALNFILKDCTLLLNSFNATNDPKESKCWELSAFSTQNPAPEAMHDNQLRLQVAERLKRGVFVACFSSDSEGLTGDHTQDILLRGLARPRMWAQYADRHRGFCIVFDKRKLLTHATQQFERRLLSGLVTYRDRSWSPLLSPNAFRIEFDLLQKHGLDEYAKKHSLHYARELYFEKLMDWHDENEWRVLLIGDVAPPTLLDFKDSVVGVIHGAETSREDSERAIALTSNMHAIHTGMKWVNHSPWYDLGNTLWLDKPASP